MNDPRAVLWLLATAMLMPCPAGRAAEPTRRTGPGLAFARFVDDYFDARFAVHDQGIDLQLREARGGRKPGLAAADDEHGRIAVEIFGGGYELLAYKERGSSSISAAGASGPEDPISSKRRRAEDPA